RTVHPSLGLPSRLPIARLRVSSRNINSPDSHPRAQLRPWGDSASPPMTLPSRGLATGSPVPHPVTSRSTKSATYSPRTESSVYPMAISRQVCSLGHCTDRRNLCPATEVQDRWCRSLPLQASSQRSIPNHSPLHPGLRFRRRFLQTFHHCSWTAAISCSLSVTVPWATFWISLELVSPPCTRSRCLSLRVRRLSVRP